MPVAVGVAGTWHLLNQAPTSAVFAQSLQIWEQGRFIRFHGLGQWLGWLWPHVTPLHVVFRVAARRRLEPETPGDGLGAQAAAQGLGCAPPSSGGVLKMRG